ncbi:MAG TPA: hypothetical protein VKA23_00580 [Mariprofundaceae bacterium]|nr:hypothetical protein [Mariprofundaceae bacterium]
MKRNPIFGSQLKRMSFLRILTAALTMYLVIPVYLFLHLICLTLLYNGIVCPLLGIERIKLRNYIIIDRHLIPGLSLTARFHCIYCGYANGICVATGVLLTQISKVSKESISPTFRLLVTIPYFLASSLSSLGQLLIVIDYNLAISPPLGLHTMSIKEAYAKMAKVAFGDSFTIFGTVGQQFIRFEHAFALILANALEQVESQWCPIKHLNRNPDAIFPEHHSFFVERCELCELKKVLCAEGTVSPRKPRL